MRGDAVLRGVVEDLRDVLVAVVGVEKIEPPVLGAHDEWTRGERFRGIPDEDRADGIRVGGVQPLDAKEVVVDKAEVRGDLAGAGLLIVHAAPHAVEGHGDYGVAGLPAHGTVFGVVDDRPNASGSFDYCLVAIRVVLRHEVIDGDVGNLAVTFVHIKKSATEEHRR